MKKFGALLLAASMVLGLLAGCGAKEEPAAAQTAEAQTEASGERTTFTVGFDAEFPPYGYMDEN